MKTCDVWIHCPAGTIFVRARMYARTSAIVSMSGTSWSYSNIAAAGACTWESMSPGNTSLPPRSWARVVPSRASRRISVEEPTATIFPPRTAKASRTVKPASTVTTLPLRKTASGGAS